jgi:hypothetical protein
LVSGHFGSFGLSEWHFGFFFTLWSGFWLSGGTIFCGSTRLDSFIDSDSGIYFSDSFHISTFLSFFIPWIWWSFILTFFSIPLFGHPYTLIDRIEQPVAVTVFSSSNSCFWWLWICFCVFGAVFGFFGAVFGSFSCVFRCFWLL